MHSSHLISRAGRACVALLVAGAFVSCNHDGPTDPLSRVQTLAAVDSALQVSAGTQTLLEVLVLDADGLPVPGVSVSWVASSGVLAKASTPSNAEGVAANKWTAAGDLGTAWITASAGVVQPLHLALEVVPGAVAQLNIVEDSVRFTVQRQKRILRVVGRDGYGHPVAPGGDQISTVANWVTITELPAIGDTALLELSSGDGMHRGFVWVQSPSGSRDSAEVILQPVVVAIQSIAGLDTTHGLVPGQRIALQVVGSDSSGYPIAGIDPVSVGLHLSSSDPGIVSVSSDGSMTGVAVGQAIINASAGGVSSRVTLTVFPEFDVGTQLANLHLASGVDDRSDTQYLSDAGTLYSLHSSCCHTPGPTVLQAYGKDGKLSWSQIAPASQYLNIVDPVSGVVFSADAGAHVVRALAATGMELWTFDYGSFTTMGCMLAGWGDGVAAWCGSHVLALRGNGSLAWSAPTTGTPWRMVTTPTHVVLQSRDSLLALDADGKLVWTRPATASEMIADASSTVYLMEQGGVRAIDASGAERWFNPTPLAACIIATTDHLVVCRDNSLLVALDPADGHVRWSITFPVPFGGPVAISGDRLLLAGGYLFALDGRSGAVIARSAKSYDYYLLAVADGVMSMSSPSYALTFSTSYAPGSEWSQNSGNAGHSNRVTP